MFRDSKSFLSDTRDRAAAEKARVRPERKEQGEAFKRAHNPDHDQIEGYISAKAEQIRSGAPTWCRHDFEGDDGEVYWFVAGGQSIGMIDHDTDGTARIYVANTEGEPMLLDVFQRYSSAENLIEAVERLESLVASEETEED